MQPQGVQSKVLQVFMLLLAPAAIMLLKLRTVPVARAHTPSQKNFVFCADPQAVERHVRSLQSWLYPTLINLKHGNGQPVVKLFGRHHGRDHHIQSCIFQVGA